MPPCLTLSNIRYVPRVKRRNPGKGVTPSPTPRCSSYWKWSLRVALDYSHQLYFYLIWIKLRTQGQMEYGGKKILKRTNWPRKSAFRIVFFFFSWVLLYQYSYLLSFTNRFTKWVRRVFNGGNHFPFHFSSTWLSAETAIFTRSGVVTW